jgi:Ca2+-binding EF-hand superfamily protein
MKPALAVFLLTLPPLVASAQPPAGGQPPSRAQAFMNTLDTNKDGKVGKTEYLKPFEAQFDAMDQNKDGTIDQAEFEAFANMMRQRMQQMRQQQGQR